MDSLLLLRPVADDYCFAASLKNGFPRALQYWLDNTQFDFFTLSSNLLVVGLPILLMPASLASVFSLLICTSAFSIFLYRLLNPGRGLLKLHLMISVFLLILSALISNFVLQAQLARFLFGQTNSRSLPHQAILSKIFQHFIDVANSWFMWGVVNSSYLIPFLMSFVFLRRIQTNDFLHSRKMLILSLLIGTSGYVISATTFLSSIIILESRFRVKELGLDLKSRAISLRPDHVKLFVPLALGVGLSFFSPGAFARRRVLSEIDPFSAAKIYRLPADFLKLIAESLLNIGNISTLFFGIVLGYLLCKNSKLSQFYLLGIMKLSLVYAGSAFIFTLISELFSYRAYWHYFTIRFSLFILFLILGIYFYVCFKPNRVIVPIAAAITGLAIVSFNVYLSHESRARYSSWSNGVDYGALSAANIDGTWVNVCYLDLKKIDTKKYYPELSHE